MARAKRSPVKKAVLTADDERWIQRMRAQAKAADPYWATRSDELYRDYARQWVVLDEGRIVFHSPEDSTVGRWLEAHDPRRNRFLVRFVPDAKAEFALYAPA